MSSIARRLERARPDFDSGWDVRVVPIAEDVSGSARPLLLVLAGAVVLLFLLGCANVANLVLGRALSRGKETAIRRALGASTARIARQWIAEGLVIASAGCAAGLAAAAWGLHAVMAAAAGRLPRIEEASLSGRSILFAALVSAAVGVAFGLLPARGRRSGLASSLAGGDRATAGKRAASWKGALAASQIAIALVLLTGAGLLVRSLDALGRVQPGFDPANVLTFRMTLPESRYGTAPSQNDFFEDLAARVRGLPGVRAAGVINTPPLGGFGPGTSFLLEGTPPMAAGDKPTADIRTVGPGALEALGIPLLAGRTFADSDRPDGPGVVLVNRTLAARFFGKQSPIGRRLSVSWGLPGGSGPVEIVGVAGDVRLSDVDKPARPAIYYAARQSPNSMMTLAVKASEDPERLLPRIRESLKAIDPAIAIERPATLDTMLARSLEGRRLPMLFLGPFSLAALLLAAIGIYGVLAFAVRERTRELGIRLALGAQRRDVLRLVLGRAAALTACGLAAGAGVALLATRAMRSLLFGVEPADPVTFAVVAAGVAAMALLASWLPARRASRIDPNDALRSQ
jgi:putative ABC transport system permease protein